MIEETIRHLVGRIEAATIEGVPCENFYLADVFPNELYGSILAHLPPDECYHPLKHREATGRDGAPTRILLDLNERTVAGLPVVIRDVWTDLHSVLTDPRLTAAILGRFSRTIPPGIEVMPVPILYRDFGGYAIGVHPDIADKVATMQFYLPEDESQLHLGTTFHVKEGDRFVEVKTNRFAPNSAYGFARTTSSWHSVKRLKMTEKPRNSIALTLYKRGREYLSE